MSTSNDIKSLFENFDETPNPILCEIKGQIPEWLNGTLLRNGPGMFRIGPNSSYTHWFDGLAFIQRFRIEHSQMFYSAKYLKSDTYKANMAAQRIVVTEFGTNSFPDPCKNIFSRFFSYFQEEEVTDNDLVNFVQCGDEVYATTETPLMNRVNIETLETNEDEQKIDYRKYVSVHSVTAHQHYDNDGNIYNIGSQFADGKYVFVKTTNPSKNKWSQTQMIGSMPVTDRFYPGYYHSFAFTQNYLILFEMPLRLNVYKLMITSVRRLAGLTHSQCLNWMPDKGVNIHVINRINGQRLPIDYRADAFFVFHHANAYEIDNCLIVDYCRLNDGSAVHRMTLDDLRAGKLHDAVNQSHLHRMIIPLNISENTKSDINLLADKPFATGETSAFRQIDGSIRLTDRRLCIHPVEFPRINYTLVNGRPYQFIYAMSTAQYGNNSTDDLIGFVKSNVSDDTSTPIVWHRDNTNQICGEPVFVAKPNGKSEDDGILLCPVMTKNCIERPFLLILDAKNMKELARCILPDRIPMAFHAHYVNSNIQH